MIYIVISKKIDGEWFKREISCPMGWSDVENWSKAHPDVKQFGIKLVDSSSKS